MSNNNAGKCYTDRQGEKYILIGISVPDEKSGEKHVILQKNSMIHVVDDGEFYRNFKLHSTPPIDAELTSRVVGEEFNILKGAMSKYIDKKCEEMKRDLLAMKLDYAKIAHSLKVELEIG